ncbi:MAG: sporulation protein YunB, partial [Clostridiales bacterium]|nr:sporulation protein YunB [Clostridiales bacterium]
MLPCALVGVGLAFLLIAHFTGEFRPVLTAMATAKVNNAVTLTLNGAVADCVADRSVEYGDVITLEKDEGGRITALTGNMAELNALRGAIMARVVEAVNGIDTHDLAIPAGNLTGIAFLSGKGLSLPVKVLSVAFTRAEYRHVFTAAGINQTWHQVMLDLTATVDILIPGGNLTDHVSTQVCVAETV